MQWVCWSFMWSISILGRLLEIRVLQQLTERKLIANDFQKAVNSFVTQKVQNTVAFSNFEREDLHFSIIVNGIAVLGL